ncbi:hypothetical protein PoB_006868400 [Plakobranchus ocellatus]|uniref:Uncharacterized protein n=1 Tax=Plakobranchus ocellatus TaxID=259542 RepID=A0AAV4DDH6_9GAST|nr:hypothetical protein PoB_006868400 [Plakobranchus ocellatus]
MSAQGTGREPGSEKFVQISLRVHYPLSRQCSIRVQIHNKNVSAGLVRVHKSLKYRHPEEKESNKEEEEKKKEEEEEKEDEEKKKK